MTMCDNIGPPVRNTYLELDSDSYFFDPVSYPPMILNRVIVHVYFERVISY